MFLTASNRGHVICIPYIINQGWRQEFSDGGLTLLTRGLKYDFQGTINAKILRKNRFDLQPSPGATPVISHVGPSFDSRKILNVSLDKLTVDSK